MAQKKKRRTEVEVKSEGRIMRFTDVPTSKVKPLLTLLKGYEDDSIPWREAASGRIKGSGGEAAHMVRVAREKTGMTQVELAEKLGMPQGNLSQIETGKRPVGKALAKNLGKIFNLDYRVFL
jgi:ribosome-binding protein aMBF1 (putative translation factor)